MKITADTNLLVRAVVGDDRVQASAAAARLSEAELVAVTIPTLCEFVWVLRRVYEFAAQDIAIAIRALLNTANVAANRTAAEAGLALLEAGGDFADGAMAHEGEWLGAEVFISFDRKAVALLTAQGRSAQTP